MPLIPNMFCEICTKEESTLGECIDLNHIGETIVVEDSELGRREGIIKGSNHEGHAMASFNEEPPVVIYPDMIIVTLSEVQE